MPVVYPSHGSLNWDTPLKAYVDGTDDIVAQDLTDYVDAAAANLQDQIDTIEASDVESVNGQTGVVVLDKTDIGLPNVDNTSDVNKPVSTAQAAAIAGVLATTVTDGDTTHAPDGNAVFDALALKQPLDGDLTTIAGLTATTDNIIQSVGSAWASRTPTQVKTALSLNNVDNTSDVNKPVSTAQAAADALAVPKSLVDAKGDLVAATANDTPAPLTVGADGTELVADSTQTTGLRWTTSKVFEGSGDPEGVVSATIGSVYRDTTNGWLYEKMTGSGNTGWMGVGVPVPRFAFPSGSYIIPHSAQGTLQGNNGTLRLAPWFCPQTLNITRIGAEVSTVGESGSKVRLGIYNDNGAGVPGTLLIDAGQIAGDSATVQDITLGSTLVMPRGWYWLGGVAQSAPTTTPTTRSGSITVTQAGLGFVVTPGTSIPGAGNQSFGYFQGSVSGGLPSPFVSGGAISTATRLHFKLA